VIVVRPESQDEGRLQQQFSEEDAAAVDYDFERTYWPGGHDAESAIPVKVGLRGSCRSGSGSHPQRPALPRESVDLVRPPVPPGRAWI